MDINTFKRILTAFADTPASIDISKGKLICEIRDSIIEATIRADQGELFIAENGEELTATSWLVRRIARVPLLADRILSAFSEPENFIVPRGLLNDQLDEKETEDDLGPGDAAALTLELLGRRPVGCSSVMYLTSDAGEGKTTLITHLARKQAERFKEKSADWLLVPVSLGGKPFLRFDDLVVGYLGNRLRFPLFFYDGFMELVKMGVLVPAFDGFEEMFVQSPSGDALSAVGQLMQKMDSQGSILIAARKAYFEYHDVRTQARLFDSIGKSEVTFSRVSLLRWNKADFLSYASKRGITDRSTIYASVAERLGDEHPLLTRAVLVKRLLDVATTANSLADLLRQVGNSPNEYFSLFVRAIIEREAQEKWINRAGEPHQPLLSIQEHIELLSSIAQEMWTLSTDSLKAEVLDLLTDLFCESKHLSAEVTYQIRERTKQHALIVASDGSGRTFAFDHEEFKNFFLGEGIGRIISQSSPQQKIELLGLLRKGSLPHQTIDAAISVVRRTQEAPCEKIATFLQELTALDGTTSFTHENVARLLLKILHGAKCGQMKFHKLSFSGDSLRDLNLVNIVFTDCTFAGTSLENTHLTNCRFEMCHFDQLELHATTKISNTEIVGGDVSSLVPAGKDEPIYDPNQFTDVLAAVGFKIPVDVSRKPTGAPRAVDMNVKHLSRLLRCFQFRTHLNQNVVLRKLGPGAEVFIRDVVPKLTKAKVLIEEWNPRDRQNRYHLSMSMERIHDALRRAGGSVDDFINELVRPN